MFEIHVESTTPPTLASWTAFSNASGDLVIYVPQGSLSSYQTASNWSNFASRMQEEPS